MDEKQECEGNQSLQSDNPLANRLTELITSQLDIKRDEIYNEFKDKLESYSNVLKFQIFKHHWAFIQRDETQSQNADQKQLFENYLSQGEVFMEHLDHIQSQVNTIPLSVEFQQLQHQFLQTEKINHYVVGKSYRCQHCDDKYTSLKQLEQHLIKENVNTIFCKLCGRQFINHRYCDTKVLRKHVLSIHDKDAQNEFQMFKHQESVAKYHTIGQEC